MKINKLEDVRVLIWLGDKLLWISREEPDKSIFPTLDVAYRYNLENPFQFADKVVWLPIIPSNISISLKTVGPNTANLTFISTRDYLLTRERAAGGNKRYLGAIRTKDEQKKYEEYQAWRKEALKENFVENYTLPAELYDLVNKDYFDEFYMLLQQIYGASDSLKFPSSMIPDTYKEVDKSRASLNFKLSYESLSWPFVIFQPMLPIWIDVRDESGNWRALFTGYIDSVSDNYTAGSSRRVSISAASSLQVLDAIPSFPNILDTLFWERIISDRYKGEKGDFLNLYFKKLGQDQDPTFWPNFWQDRKPLEIIGSIFRIANYRLGIISDEELETTSSTAIGQYWTITPEDKAKFKKLFRKYAFHKFSLFGFSEKGKIRILPYDGKDNTRDSKSFDHILLKHALLEDKVKGTKKEVKILESLGEAYAAHELQELSSIDLIELFQRVIGYSVAYYHPQRQNLSAVLKKISETLKMDVYNSPKGDLIAEFPRINYKPKFVSMINDIGKLSNLEIKRLYLDKPGKEPNRELFYSRYEDHKENYILLEPEIVNATFSVSGKIVTEYQVKGSTDVVNVGEFINTSQYSGFGFADPSLIMRFGLVESGSDTLYFALERTANNDVIKFANELAETFLQQRNAKNFNASIRLINRPDIMLGRTILIPHREFLYYVSQITYDITPGQNFASSISGTYGHPFDIIIPEVPEVFTKYRKLKLKKLTFTTAGTNSPKDDLLWSTEDFGIRRLGGGRGVDGKENYPFVEQTFPKLMEKLQAKTSLPAGVYEALAEEKWSRILVRKGQGVLTAMPLSPSLASTQNDNSVVCMPVRAAIAMLYWRFLWWCLAQRIIAFGGLVTYLVSNGKVSSIEEAMDYAAKLLFFRWDPDVNYSEANNPANCLSSLKGVTKGLHKGAIIKHSSINVNGVDLLGFYEKALKLIPNLHKAVFACDNPINIENSKPRIPDSLNALAEYMPLGGKVGANSLAFTGLSGVKIGVSSLVDPRPADRISRHPLARAFDFDYLYVSFPHPSAMLAFFIGLDLLMLCRPVYIEGVAEEIIYDVGAWTMPPPYCSDDPPPDDYKYAWFLWRLDRETKGVEKGQGPYTLYTKSSSKTLGLESKVPYYDWIAASRKGKPLTIPLLGLSYLLYAKATAASASESKCSVVDSRAVAARMIGDAGFCDEDWTFGSERWPLTFFVWNYVKEQVKEKLELPNAEAALDTLKDNGIILDKDDLTGVTKTGLYQPPTELRKYAEDLSKEYALAPRMEIGFSVIKSPEQYYLGFFLFSMLSVMYRWAWSFHILKAAFGEDYRFLPFSGEYEDLPEDEEGKLCSAQANAHLCRQPPAMLSTIRWKSGSGEDLFYAPGLGDWYDMADMYMTGTIATRWLTTNPQDSSMSYYMRMGETYKDYVGLEKHIGDCSECQNAEELVNTTGANRAACPGYETFAANSEWRNKALEEGNYPWTGAVRTDGMRHYNHIHSDVGRYTDSKGQFWTCALKDIAETYANNLEKHILENWKINDKALKDYIIDKAKEEDEAKTKKG